jgi:hypothetical protein
MLILIVFLCALFERQWKVLRISENVKIFMLMWGGGILSDLLKKNQKTKNPPPHFPPTLPPPSPQPQQVYQLSDQFEKFITI